MPNDNRKVVIVTGASGSLGSHLVHHLAQRSDISIIVCLNRQSPEDPYERQRRIMNDRGIRLTAELGKKLLVFQADSSIALLGLSGDDYEFLVASATHLIHSAWPMDGKRTFKGFESQFQVMENLIRLARDVASRRPLAFRFKFQMVSSIGVVGLYGKGQSEQSSSTVFVPEAEFGVDCVLNNGYGDAKWGCERMLSATLHNNPGRFDASVARLGQIAGSRTSGHWNPMEHFGFLVKSSQTLGVWPDLPGQARWLPVEDVAGTLTDIVLLENKPHQFYHVEDSTGQPWSRLSAVFAEALGIAETIPFEDWVERVRAAAQHDNPAAALVEFYDDDYIRMSCGGLVLSSQHALEHSGSLRTVAPVSEDILRGYIRVWKEIGFLR